MPQSDTSGAFRVLTFYETVIIEKLGYLESRLVQSVWDLWREYEQPSKDGISKRLDIYQDVRSQLNGLSRLGGIYFSIGFKDYFTEMASIASNIVSKLPKERFSADQIREGMQRIEYLSKYISREYMKDIWREDGFRNQQKLFRRILDNTPPEILRSMGAYMFGTKLRLDRKSLKRNGESLSVGDLLFFKKPNKDSHPEETEETEE